MRALDRASDPSAHWPSLDQLGHVVPAQHSASDFPAGNRFFGRSVERRAPFNRRGIHLWTQRTRMRHRSCLSATSRFMRLSSALVQISSEAALQFLTDALASEDVGSCLMGKSGGNRRSLPGRLVRAMTLLDRHKPAPPTSALTQESAASRPANGPRTSPDLGPGAMRARRSTRACLGGPRLNRARLQGVCVGSLFL